MPCPSCTRGGAPSRVCCRIGTGTRRTPWPTSASPWRWPGTAGPTASARQLPPAVRAPPGQPPAATATGPAGTGPIPAGPLGRGHGPVDPRRDPAGQPPAGHVRPHRLRPPGSAPGLGVLPARRPAPADAPPDPRPAAAGPQVPAGRVRGGAAGRPGAGLAGPDRLPPRERLALRPAAPAPHQGPVPRWDGALGRPVGPAPGLAGTARPRRRRRPGGAGRGWWRPGRSG